jgi:hypothetical protein
MAAVFNLASSRTTSTHHVPLLEAGSNTTSVRPAHRARRACAPCSSRCRLAPSPLFLYWSAALLATHHHYAVPHALLLCSPSRSPPITPPCVFPPYVAATRAATKRRLLRQWRQQEEQRGRPSAYRTTKLSQLRPSRYIAQEHPGCRCLHRRLTESYRRSAQEITRRRTGRGLYSPPRPSPPDLQSSCQPPSPAPLGARLWLSQPAYGREGSAA